MQTDPGEDLTSIARELAAIAKSGLAYSKDTYDLQRFEALLTLSARMFGALSIGAVEDFRNILAVEPGPMTPKLAVRVGVFDHTGSILLVRETTDGLWSLPGGWVNINETPAEAARKEVVEETGYLVKIDQCCGLFDQRKLYKNPLWHIVCAYFLGSIIEKTTVPKSPEIHDHGFFPRINLPSLSSRRVRAQEIQALFDRRLRPNYAPFFE